MNPPWNGGANKSTGGTRAGRPTPAAREVPVELFASVLMFILQGVMLTLQITLLNEMSKIRTIPKKFQLSPPDALKLVKTIEDAAIKFKGQFDELESALGMLVLGRLVGWKVLLLIHNKRTIRKYEEILEISIRSDFPEEGPLAGKSIGLDVVKKLGKFWKAVSGEEKIEARRELA